MKVLIIGGVATGPKTASKIIRMMPDAEVTIVEKGTFLSYAGCGFTSDRLIKNRGMT